MCEIQPYLYLISCSDSNRFKPCKVNLITRHMGTQGVPHGNFSRVRMTESFPTVTVSEIRPSSEMCDVPTARVFERSPRRCNHREGYSSYVSIGCLQATSVYRAHN